MNRAIRTLVDDLLAADDYEQAAHAALRRVLGLCRRALKAQPAWAKHATLRRGLVHLRPSLGYRGLVVREVGEALGDEPPAASSTAWRWIEQGGPPTVLDVSLSCFWGLDGELLERDTGDAFRSRSALLARAATHVLVLPLRHAGRVFGMIAVELACERAVGGRFDAFASEGHALKLVGDLASPYLSSLRSPALSAPVEGALPVVGDAMREVVGLLATFARFEETVLLRGETGTGKSHLARWCHDRSPRAPHPYVVVQVHALPEHLREGELFGWKQGAFTGASRDHEGCVQRAEGGTLFLDEIDKLPLEAQGKLLALLEERRYHALGDPVERVADVRFVVGSNVDLEQAVEDGRFLRDLYYRINVLPVALLPLRERRDEVGGWALHLLGRLHERHADSADVGVTEEAVRLLRAQPWEGNLRQLHSVLVRAYAFASVHTLGAPRVEVGEPDVRRALSLERRGPASPLLDAMGEAATAFVDLAVARQEAGDEALDLDHGAAFTGVVLEVAVARLGDEKEAFRLFGLEHRIKGGAHLKTLRRERDKVDALRDVVEPKKQAG